MKGESFANGFPNKPTWIFHLYIGDDLLTLNSLCEQWPDSGDLAQALQAYWEAEQELSTPLAGLTAELLNWAVEHIHWRELATRYLSVNPTKGEHHQQRNYRWQAANI
tara:strand:+ start:928 stop:1251 length:324 start_codon:yes stop_codon:yes gene_type:complete